MKHFFIRKRMTAILFLLLLCSAGFFIHMDEIKYKLIDVYGLTQKMMNKKEVNNFEIIKDNDGKLYQAYFANGPKDTKEYAKEVVDFKNGLRSNTTLWYVMPPEKRMAHVTKFRAGLPNDYVNETADLFLEQIEQKGITAIDLRKYFMHGELPYEDIFYNTDHHWTIPAAFYGYTVLADQLAQLYPELSELSAYYGQLTNYKKVTYKDSFLGSLGRKVGQYYEGMDDFTMLIPNTDVSYQYSILDHDNELTVEGTFEEALLNQDVITFRGSKYDPLADRYAAYLYGKHGLAHIKNKTISNGIKIAMVKDSFMHPVASFLSSICSDIYMVDPRYYKGNILEYVNSIPDLDHVIVSFSPRNFTEEFFRFNHEFQEE